MDIQSGVSLQGMTTLALPGVADWFCRVRTRQELDQALAFARDGKLPVSILGGGSNTLLQQQVPGLVIQLANHGIELVVEDDTTVILEVAAGENWHQLVMTTLENGWYGLENLALIPGCVGAAPIQNIGAYGIEIAELLVCVHTIDIVTGASRILTAEECELAYRDSIFKQALKNRVVIWAVQIRLSKIPRVKLDYPELAKAMADSVRPDPVAVAEAVIALRQAKLPDPAVIANAGSFFKNPILPAQQAQRLLAAFPDIPHYTQGDGSIKFPAAWLIDRAGWKGMRRDHVGVHDRQALVLVHYGSGTGTELLSFAAEIADDIRQKFAIELEMEPVILGRGAP